MKCVLIAEGIIAAVSECNTLPTAPGWKTAWYGETYTVGEPVYLFDDKLRRRPIDPDSSYGRAVVEHQSALHRIHQACIEYDKAIQERKDAEAFLENLYEQVERSYEAVERKTAEEKLLRERAQIAEKDIFKKAQAVQDAAQVLIDQAADEERKVHEEQEVQEVKRKAHVLAEAEAAKEAEGQAEKKTDGEEKPECALQPESKEPEKPSPLEKTAVKPPPGKKDKKDK